MGILLNTFNLQLGPTDFIYSLFLLCIIFIFANIYKERRIYDYPFYRFFLPGLFIKFIFGFAFVAIHLYYYKGGDTFAFFHFSKGMLEHYLNYPDDFLEIILSSSEEFEPLNYPFTQTFPNFFTDDDVFMMLRVTSILTLLGFKSFVGTTIIFCFISYFGIWAAYSVFCRFYPFIERQLFWGFMLSPSVVFWSSGVLKDTITLACVCWILYGFANIFKFKRRIGLSVIIVLVSTYFTFMLKAYILYVLYPCLFLWIYFDLTSNVRDSVIRFFITPIMLLITSGFLYFILQKISSNAGLYSLENMESTLEGFHSWHSFLSETRGQSGYSLGEVDFSPFGILKQVPAAFTVTFYRPFIWEIRNATTFIGAIESLVVLVLSVYVFLKLKSKLFRFMFVQQEVRFLFIFSLIFGVMVGVSSYNFGALSRYKIPAQLFYITCLILLYNFDKVEKLYEQRDEFMKQLRKKNQS